MGMTAPRPVTTARRAGSCSGKWSLPFHRGAMVAAGFRARRTPFSDHPRGTHPDHHLPMVMERVCRRCWAPGDRQQRAVVSNWPVPYRLTDQPEPIETVLIHLGYDVRMARYRQFETQSRLSARAGLSQSTWSMVENRLAEGVRLETLARVAIALGGELALAQCRHPA